MNTPAIETAPRNDGFATGTAEIDGQQQTLIGLLKLVASHSASHTRNAIFKPLTEYSVHHVESGEAVRQGCFLRNDHRGSARS